MGYDGCWCLPEWKRASGQGGKTEVHRKKTRSTSPLLTVTPKMTKNSQSRNKPPLHSLFFLSFHTNARVPVTDLNNLQTRAISQNNRKEEKQKGLSPTETTIVTAVDKTKKQSMSSVTCPAVLHKGEREREREGGKKYTWV